MTDSMSRRRLLQAGGALGLSAGAAALAGCSHQAQREAPLQAVRMAMHIHSCFSEGTASMLTHLDQAERHGVDVIWWTDHDFRVQAYGYYHKIGCDGSEEGQKLSWQPGQGGKVQDADHQFETVDGSADRVLRVTGHAPSTGWGSVFTHPNAGNSFYSTNLSDTTLTVDVLGEQIGPDAEAYVEVKTSYRPATHGRPAGIYFLHYRLGTTAARTLEEPLLGVVQARSSGKWQTLSIDPLADIKLFWPDLDGRDSSLMSLRFGVRMRTGATGTASFRNVTFTRTRDDHRLTWGLQLQRTLTEHYRPSYRKVIAYPSSEVSLVRHLNVFMDDLVLYPYTGPAKKDDSAHALQAMVDWYSKRGALVQYNHPPQTSGAELVAHKGFGAHAIELGRDSHYKAHPTGGNTIMGDRIDMFDAAARNAIFMTATGVTDDHDGTNWAAPGDAAQRYVTSVWAASKERDDLRAALFAGRAWWHDLLLWPDAELDLTVRGRRAMGQVWRTSATSATVSLVARNLPPDSEVHLIIGDCDRGGSKPAITEQTLPTGEFVSGSRDYVLERRSGRYLRVELHDSQQRVLGFGNPFWLLPVGHPAKIPTARKFAG